MTTRPLKDHGPPTPHLRTLLRGGGVVAFDGSRHVHLKRGDVVFCGGRIEYAGPQWVERADAPVHETIDTTGKLVVPGLVNTHLHVTDTPFTRGWLDDYASSAQAGAASNVTALYRLLPAVRAAALAEDQLAAAECAFSELLLSGSTTVVELGYDEEMGDRGDMATPRAVGDIAGRLGLRCYLAPRYRSRYWKLGPDGAPAYFSYEGDGLPRMLACVELLGEIHGTHQGRVRGMLAPGQVDTCEPALLRATREAADKTGYLIQLHAGQSPSEFRRIRQQHGCTTLEYLDRLGLLGRDLILGHSMFFSESGDVDECNSVELQRLRDSGTHLCHLPWVKARQGTVMRSFARYRRLGIQVCLGTDTYPFDMFNEMRMAAAMCRVADGSPQAVTAAEIFHAATVGGAQALQRDDLGRLAAGCQADIVLVDVNRPHAVPLRDAIQHLVLSASAADVDSVFIAGRRVVDRRELVYGNLGDAVARLAEAGERVEARVRVE
jgi:5-methylthioadenosine/S-adenosylhomocysteine deaminase